MRHEFKIATAEAAFFMGSALAAAVGNLIWRRATAKMVRSLLIGEPPSGIHYYSSDQLADLPDPVARYFEYALTPGQPLFLRFNVTQAGEMRLGGFGSPWTPFKAMQHFATNPAGFIWDARFPICPFMSIQVRDSFLHGGGGLKVRIAPLFTVASFSGRPEIDSGDLHRYLAEAVWCPTALLPSQGVVWEPLNDSAARATLTVGGTSASLEFGFGERGEIVRAFTPGRFRAVKKEFVPTPWLCSYSDYSILNGMKIPLEGEVEWDLPEGRLTYFRSRLIDVKILGNNALPAR